MVPFFSQLLGIIGGVLAGEIRDPRKDSKLPGCLAYDSMTGRTKSYPESFPRIIEKDPG